MPDNADPRLAWLAAYGPRGTGVTPPKRRLQGLPPGSVADLVNGIARTVIGATGSVPMPTSSVIIGPDAAAAVELDVHVANAMGAAAQSASGAAFDQLVAAFAASPLTGCTSVMDMALARSGWNPLDPRQMGNQQGFHTYAAILAQTPFFVQPPQTAVNAIDALDHGNPAGLAVQVASLLPDTEPADRARVVSAILDMAHAVFTGRDGSASAEASLFVQHAMSVNGATITINLYWSQVYMQYDRHSDKSSVSVSEQARLTVERISFLFPTENWPRYAEAVARQQITLVSQWLAKTTSV